MDKKLWTGAVVVFVVFVVLDMLVNAVLLAADYQATSHLWRPEAEMKMWLFILIDAFIAFFFTLIFSKGYEGKGVMEGLRYGFYVGMLMAVPMAYGMYGAMPIPYGMALKWFIFGLIEFMVCGVIVAAVYGKQATVTRATQA
jgi:hypothetical protein